MSKQGIYLVLITLLGNFLWGCSPGAKNPGEDKNPIASSGMEKNILSLSLQEKSGQLNQAIKDLKDPSKIVRRNAAEQISFLITTPGIQRAIKPLAEVLLNRGIPSGIFTQEICATNLGRIAAHLGSPQGNHAIQALVESLKTEKFDSVRAASANALGITNNQLAVAPLQEALANDPSPLVKFAAQEALHRLARSGIEINQSAQSLSAQSKIPGPAPGDTALREYLKKQIIYSNPPLEDEGGEK